MYMILNLILTILGYAMIFSQAKFKEGSKEWFIICAGVTLVAIAI